MFAGRKSSRLRLACLRKTGREGEGNGRSPIRFRCVGSVNRDARATRSIRRPDNGTPRFADYLRGIRRDGPHGCDEITTDLRLYGRFLLARRANVILRRLCRLNNDRAAVFAIVRRLSAPGWDHREILRFPDSSSPDDRNATRNERLMSIWV